MARLGKRFDKYLGSGSKVGKVAKKVATSGFVGGKGLVDYAGGRGTRKGALKSAAQVASIAVGGGIGIGRKAIARGIKKVVTKGGTRVPRSIKLAGNKRQKVRKYSPNVTQAPKKMGRAKARHRITRYK